MASEGEGFRGPIRDTINQQQERELRLARKLGPRAFGSGDWGLECTSTAASAKRDAFASAAGDGGEGRSLCCRRRCNPAPSPCFPMPACSPSNLLALKFFHPRVIKLEVSRIWRFSLDCARRVLYAPVIRPLSLTKLLRRGSVWRLIFEILEERLCMPSFVLAASSTKFKPVIC